MLIKQILTIAVLMLVIDFAYLMSIGDYFNKQIKSVQGSDLKMRYLGGAICYPFLVLGLYYFIIKRSYISTDHDRPLIIFMVEI